MKLSIIGLPQTGKKSIYELLTGNRVPDSAGDKKKPVPGQAFIRDERFKELAAMYKPKKEAPAQIEIQVLPKYDPTSPRDYDVFKDVEDADALCHIVRAFQDDSIYHCNGSVDPMRDIETVNSELLLHDLLFTEKRIERMESDNRKKKDSVSKQELDLMKRFMDILEEGQPLRKVEIDVEDMKIIKSYPFLTLKKLIVVINVGEEDILDASLVEKAVSNFADQGIDVIAVPVKTELEIAMLDNEEERKEFMDEMGIAEPALNRLSRLAMLSLGLISFFTVGSDEVKQWLVREGSLAPEAAGVIHSDIQRGFIRAEMMKYDELMSLGSEEELKKAGKYYVMGRDYIVHDGDIMSFRFNV